MGTDVYMKWDKQTKKEENGQITGYSIKVGNAGYLRASIWMTEENTVLRSVFPDEVWQGEKEEYNFLDKKNRKNLDKAVRSYLFAKLTGIKMPISEGAEKQKAFGDSVLNLFKSTGWETDAEDTVSLRDAITWVSSLCAFYDLGEEKQKAKKRPRVHISW